MVAPLWWWPPRAGALFKGGIDRRAWARQIALLGILQPRRDELAGVERVRVLAGAPRVQEDVPDAEPGSLRVFRGEGRQFRDLHGQASVLRAALTEAALPRWREVAARGSSFAIGINVRRGRDFRDAQAPEDFVNRGALRTPLEWFVKTLQQVRRAAGRDAPALVVSDGEPSDLRSLTELGGVTLLRPGCAISDVLALAGTRVLIGSGGSSFSAWAAFLGGMPTVTYPGQSLGWFGLEVGGKSGVTTFNPEQADAAFLERAAAALRVNPPAGETRHGAGEGG